MSNLITFPSQDEFHWFIVSKEHAIWKIKPKANKTKDNMGSSACDKN